MTVQVLVSAWLDSINQVPALVASLPPRTPVLVIHQITGGTAYPYDRLFTGPDIEVVPCSERGLARSRNRAVSLATGDILLPTDADVNFLPGAIDRVTAAFRERHDAMLMTFQASAPDGTPYKRYARQAHRHSLLTIRRVSSIEIAVRRSAFETGLRWDTRFGINGRFPGGLELAFMKNVLEHGLPAYYSPQPVVTHPRDSTGHRHSAASAYFRGAIYARLYGPFAYLLLGPFALRNAWRTGSPGDMLTYVQNLYRGARDLRADSSSST